MLEKLEEYIFEKCIKKLIYEENGEKKISREKLDKLNLTAEEGKLIMDAINKQKIKIVNEMITRKDRSPYISDNNYGYIEANNLQEVDKQVKSRIEYSKAGEKIFEDYKKLDKYLEKAFIPIYVKRKQRKNKDGEKEFYLSIKLSMILKLKLSEAEFEHVMNYLKEKNIKVSGKDAMLSGEFENYYCVNLPKSDKLPLSIPSDITLQKIARYKQTNNQKLREEIIEENMRLVKYVLYKYPIFTNVNLEELKSYGYEGLILALENYDINFGYAFSTYAISYIRGYIASGINEILLGKKDHFYTDVLIAKNAIEKDAGLTIWDDPNLIDDIVDLLVVSGKVTDNILSKDAAKRKIVSLFLGNISLNEEENMEQLTSEDYLVDSHDYAEEVMNLMFKDHLLKMLDVLSDREKDIIKLWSGFYDGEPKSLSEIAKIYDVSVSRIKQIKEKALIKLRNPYRLQFLKSYSLDFEEEKYVR